MKRFLSTAIFALVLSSLLAQAWGYGMPKREFRSAWVATVWGLDWPSQGAGAT